MRTCIKLLHPQLHHVRHTISRWYHKESFTHTLTLTTSLHSKRTKHTERKALSIIGSDQTEMENARLPAQTNRIPPSTSFLARRTTSRRNARGATHLVLPLLPIAAALRTMDGAHDLTKVCPVIGRVTTSSRRPSAVTAKRSDAPKRQTPLRLILTFRILKAESHRLSCAPFSLRSPPLHAPPLALAVTQGRTEIGQRPYLSTTTHNAVPPTYLAQLGSGGP